LWEPLQSPGIRTKQNCQTEKKSQGRGKKGVFTPGNVKLGRDGGTGNTRDKTCLKRGSGTKWGGDNVAQKKNGVFDDYKVHEHFRGKENKKLMGASSGQQGGGFG